MVRPCRSSTWRGRPAEADEPAVGVVEIVETVEEVHAGIDERRPRPTDANERRRRISSVAEREAINRMSALGQEGHHSVTKPCPLDPRKRTSDLCFNTYTR